jgi:hypothetical protein
MATTTNYGWATPDDTDLVKDGAAAIRTLGSSADTTVKALSPGTTAGDLDYYTSGTAKARLGIGTAGQVLQVNSGATAPEWAAPAGGTDTWTLLNTGGTALTGAATITVSGITSSKLFIQIDGASSVNALSFIGLRFNADSTNNYNQSLSAYEVNGSYNKNAWYNDTTTLSDVRFGRQGDEGSNTVSGFCILENCTSTSRKVWQHIGGGSASSANDARVYSGLGFYLGASAITSVSAISTSGNFDAGTIFVYGA